MWTSSSIYQLLASDGMRYASSGGRRTAKARAHCAHPFRRSVDLKWKWSVDERVDALLGSRKQGILQESADPPIDQRIFGTLLGCMLPRELNCATVPEHRHGSTPRCPSGSSGVCDEQHSRALPPTARATLVGGSSPRGAWSIREGGGQQR
jgi:hypothetical protein